MMFRRLKSFEAGGGLIRVAVVGSGFVARGLVHQLGLTPGMTCSLMLARTPANAVAALTASGHSEADLVVSDEPTELTEAVAAGRVAVAADPEVLRSVQGIDVVVEATGDVQHGARVALLSIGAGMHFVSLNFETDATVGPLLKLLADRNAVVYAGSDGDQPGVMMRMCEYVEGIGLDVVAAVNCKGFMDVHATPDTIRPWAEKQGTSLMMTTAFTDGTKMNVENVCVANATGLVPAQRGMLGIETTLADAVADFESALDRVGVVEYTLGGDFKGGIFVIGSGAHPELAAPYLDYLKMGSGPWYLFYRPWHLVQLETPLSIAEAVLDREPTIAPMGAPVAEVVTIAKRDLGAGVRLDGVGGYDCYGEIDTVEGGEGLLPVGLAEHATTTRTIAVDDAVGMSDVELDEDAPIVQLWQTQTQVFTDGDAATPSAFDLADLWSSR